MTKKLNKILYVEDDQDIAEVAMMTLEDLGGFTVKHCDGGQKALDAYAGYAPDLVLMDVMMPEMDGLETFDKIREIPEGKNIPIIFMTAKAQMHEQKQYIAKGALGVVVKPFDPMTLCDTIQSIWDKHNNG